MANYQSPQKIDDTPVPPPDHRPSQESLPEASPATSEGPIEGSTLLAFIKKHVPNPKGAEPRNVFPQTAAVPSPTVPRNVGQSAQIFESGQLPDDQRSLASESVKSEPRNRKIQALPATRSMAMEQGGDGGFL